MRKDVPNPGRDSGEAGAAPRSSLVGILIVTAILLWLVAGLVYAPCTPAGERARRACCASYLKQIAYGCILYSGDNAEAFPADLGALVGEYVSDARLFVCPSSGRSFEEDTPPSAPVSDENLSYCYVSGLRSSDPKRYILAFDEEWNHPKMSERGRDYEQGVNIAHLDGSVHWTSDLAALHEMLAKQAEEVEASGRSMKILRPSWSRWPEPPPELPGRMGWSWPFWLIVASVALLVIAVVVHVVRQYKAWTYRI